MSNSINALIKLRSDDLITWISKNPIINENELIVVKNPDGKLSLKLGTGTDYLNTPDIPYDSLSVNNLVTKDGTYYIPSLENKIESIEVNGVTANIDDNKHASVSIDTLISKDGTGKVYASGNKSKSSWRSTDYRPSIVSITYGNGEYAFINSAREIISTNHYLDKYYLVLFNDNIIYTELICEVEIDRLTSRIVNRSGSVPRSVNYVNNSFVVICDTCILVLDSSRNLSSYDISIGGYSYCTLNDILIAYTRTSSAKYTLDGINWNSFSELDPIQISLHTDKYINGFSGGIQYSLDGVDWIPTNITSGIYKIYYNRFYLAQDLINNKILYSIDGIEWIYSKDYANSLSLYNDKFYCASNNSILTSDDGLNWSIEFTPIINSTDQCYARLISGNSLIAYYSSGVTRNLPLYIYGTSSESSKYELADKYDLDKLDSNKLDSYVAESRYSSLYTIFSNIQVIKPEFDNYSQLKLVVSLDPDFSTELFSIDSRYDLEPFKGLINSGDRVYWSSIDELGFGMELDNKPVRVNLLSYLRDNKVILTQDTILYIKYYWYTLNSDNTESISDIYSTTLPSNTEVGANSQDTVGKKEFVQFKESLEKSDRSVDKTDAYPNSYFVCHSNSYNKLNESVNSDDYIVLNEYSKLSEYDIEFTVGDSDINLTFAIEGINGIELINELNPVDSYVFYSNRTYVISIKNGQIKINSNKIYITDSVDMSSSEFSDAVLSIINNNYTNAEVTQY